MSQAARERLIADRYAMDSILRQGRAGVVWRATDVVDGTAVAVEEIEPEAESEAERDQRWPWIVQAAQVAATLEHPGVVRLLDVLLDGERYFVVTELAEGLALSELLDRHGRLPWQRVARIGVEVLDVLEAAHRAPVPAPEQLGGERAGPPADLWALGATMYEAAEGCSPFAAGPASILYERPRPPEHAGALAPLIESLLDETPERRPPAAEARERLRDLAEGGTQAGGAGGPGGPEGQGGPGGASTSTPPLIAATVPRASDAATSVLAPARVGLAGEAVGRAARAAAGRAARARVGAGLAIPGWREAVDWLLDPRRRGLVVGSGSMVLALLSFVLIVSVIGNPTGSRTGAAAPPAGWTLFADDPIGYRIAFPASWEVVHPDDQTVEFHDRSVPTIMRVRFAPAPVPDPVAAQVQSSQEHAAIHEGSHQQTRLDPDNFQGRPGAVLEFTFLGDDQQPYRAVELGTNTPPGPNGPGYWVTIFVQSREVDWGVAQSLLQTALDSFVPPPS